MVLGRPIAAVRRAEGVAWFRFEQLCDGPRGADDYIEVARCFHTVLLSEVPIIGARERDRVRRFISLVDELYDRNVNLVISAAAPPAGLYPEGRDAFEFERTRSRLEEMRTRDYLHRNTSADRPPAGPSGRPVAAAAPIGRAAPSLLGSPETSGGCARAAGEYTQPSAVSNVREKLDAESRHAGDPQRRGRRPRRQRQDHARRVAAGGGGSRRRRRLGGEGHRDLRLRARGTGAPAVAVERGRESRPRFGPRQLRRHARVSGLPRPGAARPRRGGDRRGGRGRAVRHPDHHPPE